MDFKEFEKSIITDYDAMYYTRGRDGRKLDRIVLHHWGSRGQRFWGIINWFCKWNTYKTSCHYVVGEGKVAQIVNDSDTSYHAGNWDWNCKAIGLECMPEKHERDLHLTAKLVAFLWKRYGKLPVYEHRDIVSTSCPGIWSASEVTRLAEKYYKGSTIKTSKTKTVKDFFKVQLGAFKSKKNADKYVKQLKEKGLDAYVISTETGKGKKTPVKSTSKVDLIKKGQKALGVNTTGKMNKETKDKAIKTLQKALNKTYGYNLAIDGSFGPVSKNSLKSHYAERGDKNDFVKAIQILLLLNGYDLVVDGSFGAKTLRVVESFQSENRLTIDGNAGFKTVTKLINL